MLSGNCTEALSIQANVTISGSGAKLINNDIAPLPFPLPALLKQYWCIKREERVRVRGHAPFYATLGFTLPFCWKAQASAEQPGVRDNRSRPNTNCREKRGLPSSTATA